LRKGINIITNESLGSKLINSMSLGESMFLAGFNQKTTKEDLNVKGKYGIPPRHPHGKTLEGSRSHATKAEDEAPTCGAGRPIGGADRSLWDPPVSHLVRSVSHHH
jgi:hypothetical protein